MISFKHFLNEISELVKSDLTFKIHCVNFGIMQSQSVIHLIQEKEFKQLAENCVNLAKRWVVAAKRQATNEEFRIIEGEARSQNREIDEINRRIPSALQSAKWTIEIINCFDVDLMQLYAASVSWFADRAKRFPKSHLDYYSIPTGASDKVEARSKRILRKLQNHPKINITQSISPEINNHLQYIKDNIDKFSKKEALEEIAIFLDRLEDNSPEEYDNFIRHLSKFKIEGTHRQLAKQIVRNIYLFM